MKAAQINALGPSDGIRVFDVERPEPAPTEILVRVSHGAVNHVDTFVRSGAWRTQLSFPFTVGRDAVGVVEAVGSAVPGTFAPGDAVWTNSLGYAGRNGALAEYVTVPVERLYPLPVGVQPADMAALCHPGATAHLALFRQGQVRSGQHLLVVGAGGNIGRILVRLGREAGAEVTAVARAAHHPDLARLGAHRTLTVEALATATDVPEFDLTVDAAGLNDLARYCERARSGGRIVLLAGMGMTVPVPIGGIYLKGLLITGFAISNATGTELAEAAAGLNAAVAAGLRPHQVVVRALEETSYAHRDLEDGRVRGKQVIAVRDRNTEGAHQTLPRDTKNGVGTCG